MEYYTSDSSESDSGEDRSTIDLSDMGVDSIAVAETLSHVSATADIRTLLLYHNGLSYLPDVVERFLHLRYLDISSNYLTDLPDVLCSCPLNTLIAKNNRLSSKSLPPGFSKLSQLRELNLNGNHFDIFPPEVLELTNLRFLYMGGNKISDIPREIRRLQNLQVLSMGGNLLTGVPVTLGQLVNLTALVLSDNQLQSLPGCIANLNNLKSLLLHKNRLRMLPTEIIALKCLTELSLRDNPLVVRFVSDMTYSVPSLLELAARALKLGGVNYMSTDLPRPLSEYLSTAHHCINPKCKGVFFDNRVEHVKFVDFCGKYRVPLLQYLCSANCIDDKDDVDFEPAMMRKVLLG